MSGESLPRDAPLPVSETVPAVSAKSVRRRWLVALGSALLLSLLITGGIVAKRRSTAGFGELRGVRLGMTVRDVRARFDAAGAGAGKWESDAAGDMVLRWKPTADARGGPLAAQFEFHMGILMAIRADVAPGDVAANGPAFALSESTVVVRDATDAGPVHLTVIARSCPTHAQEAERLVHRHAR